MKITDKWLTEHGACTDGMAWVAAQDTDDAVKLIKRLQSYNVDWAIWLMTRIDDLEGLLKADVNVKNNNGTTALIWAASNGHAKVVSALIAAGADVNVKNNNGTTALMWAAYNGHAKVVSLLKKAGAI